MNRKSENLNVPVNWKIKKLSGALGAEITGVSLANASNSDIDSVKSLLVEHMVLFFPGQSPSVEEHVALGRRFGELEGHPNLQNPTDSHPEEMFELAATSGGVAEEWHTDTTLPKNPAWK